MTEQTASRHDEFQTVLREQQRRVVAALTEEETMDATPIIQEDEDISAEEYVTLVYELHHVQLPQLQAAGVIEFDRHREIVRQGTNFNEGRIGDTPTDTDSTC